MSNVVLRLAHDEDFGIEVREGDAVVAKVNADFLGDNGLFQEDTSEEYDRGTDVVTYTLAALLEGRYEWTDGALKRVVRRLVEPGGYFEESQLEFQAVKA